MKTWKIVLKSADGSVAFTGTATTEEVVAELPAKSRNEAAQGSSNGERMTDPQLRYLFRLLAAQGAEGKAAEQHLKEYFEVRSLRDVSKASASELIQKMVDDRKEAGHGA
jgi:hypothetical protein